MPGPKPVPKNLLAFRGSWRGKLPEAQPEVCPDVEIPGCPEHLLPEARKFWERLAPELEKLALIALIDEAALALVCQEWAHLVWHEQALQADMRAAVEHRAIFDAQRAAALAAGKKWKRTWKGGDGFTLPTPNGSWTYNPHWVARNKHALLLDKFLASFGMSPSSRGRVTAGNARQLELPGFPEKVAGGFGAI